MGYRLQSLPGSGGASRRVLKDASTAKIAARMPFSRARSATFPCPRSDLHDSALDGVLGAGRHPHFHRYQRERCRSLLALALRAGCIHLGFDDVHTEALVRPVVGDNEVLTHLLLQFLDEPERTAVRALLQRVGRSAGDVAQRVRAWAAATERPEDCLVASLAEGIGD